MESITLMPWVNSHGILQLIDQFFHIRHSVENMFYSEIF